MNWPAFVISLELGLLVVVLLLPLGVLAGRALAVQPFRGRGLIEAALALPLVLPPTVLGFYFLASAGHGSFLGGLYRDLFGSQLVFTFEALVIASMIVNIPFAVQPVQRAFEGIPREIREAAACCRMSPWRAFWRIELPLAWPGILTATVLTFAHTLGEFGVVLMVGGNIPGETRTLSIAIYDEMQAFNMEAAGRMSALLLAVSMVTIAVSHILSSRIGRRHV
jgi:molybdate transport system permease protein